LIAPAKIIGAAPQSQSSTISTASLRDHESIRPEVEDSTSKRSIGESEQIIVSRSVAEGPRAAAATIDGGLPAAKSTVAAGSIEKQPTAPESGTAGARAPIGRSEITVAVPQHPIAGAAVTPGEAPIGVLRWTAVKPVSQPRVDAIGTKIFAAVNSTMITRMPHFVFGSAPRNLQQVDDSLPSAALSSAVARIRIVTGSSGMPPAMPSGNIQTLRPNSTTAFPLGEIHKVEPPALTKSARLTDTENLRNVTSQTIPRVNGASVENERSIHHKVVAGPLFRGVNLPAVQPSTGEEVKLAGNWQLQRGGAPSSYRTSGFAEGYVGTIFKRGSSSIVSRWSAMPLSIGSVNAGGNRYFGGESPRAFADNLGASGPRVSRMAAEGLSGGLSRGSVSEAGRGVRVSSGVVSHAVQTQEASANTHGIYPLLSRTGSESLHGSSGSTGPPGAVSSVHGDGYGIGLAAAYAPLGFVSSIFRKSMSVAELGRNTGSTLPISPRRTLPLIRGGLLFRNFSGASDLRHVDAARVAAPRLLARSPALHGVVSDSLPDTASPPQGMQSFGGFSTGMSQSTTSEAFLLYPSPPAGPTPVLLSTKAGAPNLLRSLTTAKRLQEPFGNLAARKIAYDMPLAVRALAAPDRQSAIVPSLQGAALQAVAQQTGPPVSHAFPISGAESANKPGEIPAAGAQQKIDLDEIVEKAWQKLMRKLTIERERRGYTRWA
jgi:hypothetical protein